MTGLFFFGIAFALIGFVIAYTRSWYVIQRRCVKQGPGHIVPLLRRSFWGIVFLALVVVVLLGVLEMFVPAFHSRMIGFHFDRFGGRIGMETFAGGGGLSWGLYLSCLLGLWLGAFVGLFVECRRIPNTRGIPAVKLVKG